MVISGFRAAAAAAGIKKHGGLDLALIVAEQPVAAAGVFTRNRVKAAPVLLCRRRLKAGTAQAILVNSGNANACTGPAGLRAARETTQAVARELKLAPELILPASTGVIGQPLPVEKIVLAVPLLVAHLRPDGFGEAAQAIMTTDTRPKSARTSLKLAGHRVTLAGIAKGAGMIHPDMATLLAFLFTDAAVSAPVLQALLRQAVDQTLNCISIDGDTSTNDTVLFLASGRAGNPTLTDPGEPGAVALAAALTEVLADLGSQIVADGEGVRHRFRILITGAATPGQAKKAAVTIATSPLVKTAMAGPDVNWGRLMAALGRSGARFNPARVDISFGEVMVVRQGVGLGEQAEAAALQAILAGPITITLNLNAGEATAHVDTCDLTEDYVRINASYRS
ncbi:MAG: bifunctional glutamate N-acetyltransferase/amino-acid acetyltransferase ArgJ [Desulfobaccales bacterium]